MPPNVSRSRDRPLSESEKVKLVNVDRTDP